MMSFNIFRRQCNSVRVRVNSGHTVRPIPTTQLVYVYAYNTTQHSEQRTCPYLLENINTPPAAVHVYYVEHSYFLRT